MYFSNLHIRTENMTADPQIDLDEGNWASAQTVVQWNGERLEITSKYARLEDSFPLTNARGE